MAKEQTTHHHPGSAASFLLSITTRELKKPVWNGVVVVKGVGDYGLKLRVAMHNRTNFWTQAVEIFLLIFIYMHKFWVVGMDFCFCFKLENLDCDIVWGHELLAIFCHSLKYELLGKMQQYCLRIIFDKNSSKYLNSILLGSSCKAE